CGLVAAAGAVQRAGAGPTGRAVAGWRPAADLQSLRAAVRAGLRGVGRLPVASRRLAGDEHAAVTSAVLGLVAYTLAALQEDAAFHVMRPGELVEQRALCHLVGVVEAGDVAGQGLRVAGNVQHVVEAPGQLAGGRLHAGAWR